MQSAAKGDRTTSVIWGVKGDLWHAVSLWLFVAAGLLLVISVIRAEARRPVMYLLFLTIVVLFYWVLPRRPRLWLIFLSSLTFYGFWRVEFLPLLLVSTATEYWVARAILSCSIHQRCLTRARKGA